MATRYIYSGASGAGTGADWTNAHTTLAAAISASSAGDVFYVAHDHAATQASTKTLTFKGTAASPDRVYCVDRAGSVPPVAADLRTTGSEATTGGNNLQINGNIYIYGLIFSAGSGTGGGALQFAQGSGYNMVFEACSFINAVNSNFSGPVVGANTAYRTNVEWNNCTLQFANSGNKLNLANSGRFVWKNTAGTAGVTGTIPTILIQPNNSALDYAEIRGVDLSAVTGTLVDPSGVNAASGPIRLVNCKLASGVTVSLTPVAPSSGHMELIGCGSAGNIARNEKHCYQGALTTETTVIRTGGASDGVTAYSWKIVSNANNEREFPFETFEGVIWNDATGSSKTLTIHALTDSVTLTSADLNVEVDYLGSSATPLASVVTNAPATPLTAGSNLSSSSESWTTTGLTTPVKQKLEVTFTPQMAGPVRWRVRYGKTSSTVYICPKAELS